MSSISKKSYLQASFTNIPSRVKTKEKTQESGFFAKNHNFLAVCSLLDANKGQAARYLSYQPSEFDHNKALNSLFEKLDLQDKKHLALRYNTEFKHLDTPLGHEALIQKYKMGLITQKKLQMITTSLIKKAITLEEACKLLRNAKSVGAADTIVFSAVIAICAKEGHWQEAIEVLQEMKNEGAPPNTITYSAAISACGKGGQGQKALELLTEMKNAGIKPNVITYNALISACEKGGQGQKALELLTEMKNAGIVPDAISYSAILAACRKSGLWQESLNALSQMKESGIAPNAINYKTVLATCEKAAQGHKAVELLTQMENENTPLDTIAYSIAISACEKSNLGQQALELLSQMKKRGVALDTVVYSAAISACEKGGLCQEALKLFEVMKTEHLTRDSTVYSAVLSACEKSGQWEKAFVIIEQALVEKVFLEHLGVHQVPHEDIVQINFHHNSLFAINLNNCSHIVGISLSVAKCILKYLFLKRKDFFKKTVHLIVGSHGDDILKNGVRDFITINFQGYDVQGHPSNPGILVLMPKN